MDLRLEDGVVLTNKGLDLISKVLLGQCEMNYTRMVIGDGIVAEDTDLKEMTEVPNAKGSGIVRIAEFKGNGEATVFSKFISESFESGFFINFVGLFADDPDDGEIMYACIALQSNANWLRPAGGMVTNEVNIYLTVIVSNVESITVTYSPDDFVTQEELEERLSHITGGTDYPIISRTKPEEMPVGGSWIGEWDVQTGEEITIVQWSDDWHGGSVGSGGNGNGYTLPTASATRLGGVKVGDNLTIDSGGTLSATGELSAEVIDGGTA